MSREPTPWMAGYEDDEIPAIVFVVSLCHGCDKRKVLVKDGLCLSCLVKEHDKGVTNG